MSSNWRRAMGMMALIGSLWAVPSRKTFQDAIQDSSKPPQQAQAGNEIKRPPYKPQFAGDPAHSAAEASALGYIRTLIDAQRAYKKKHAKYATSLLQLVGSQSFTRRMTKTDRGEYTVMFKPGYSVALTPKKFDAEHRAFYADEDGVIKVDVEQPATAASPVLKAGE